MCLNKHMKKHSPNTDPSNRKLRDSARAVALTAALALSACSTQSGEGKQATADKTPIEAPTSTTSFVPETTTTTESPQAQVNTYLQSPERSAKLANLTTEMGTRFVKSATEKGGAYYGKVKAYNPLADKYGLTDNEGWVWLQPKDAAIDANGGFQVSATVYQNANGSIDLSKGVLGFDISKINDATSSTRVELEAPNEHQFTTNPDLAPWKSWTTLYASPESDTIASTLTGSFNSAEEVAQLDQKVVETTHQLVTEARF